MKKTLKATAAIITCCLLIVVVVIYAPTPKPTRIEKERVHVKLTLEALKKVPEANIAFHKVVHYNNNNRKVYLETTNLNPLLERYTRAIEGLTEASESVKRRTEELQRLNEEDTHLKSLIETNVKANTKLIAALTKASAEVKALTELLQRFTEQNAHRSLGSFMDATKYMSTTNKMAATLLKAQTALSVMSEAHHKYQMARIDARW